MSHKFIQVNFCCSHPLWFFMCCHLCKLIKPSLKTSLIKSQFNSTIVHAWLNRNKYNVWLKLKLPPSKLSPSSKSGPQVAPVCRPLVFVKINISFHKFILYKNNCILLALDKFLYLICINYFYRENTK